MTTKEKWILVCHETKNLGQPLLIYLLSLALEPVLQGHSFPTADASVTDMSSLLLPPTELYHVNSRKGKGTMGILPF